MMLVGDHALEKVPYPATFQQPLKLLSRRRFHKTPLSMSGIFLNGSLGSLAILYLNHAVPFFSQLQKNQFSRYILKLMH